MSDEIPKSGENGNNCDQPSTECQYCNSKTLKYNFHVPHLCITNVLIC